jgi:hypothetical protein
MSMRLKASRNSERFEIKENFVRQKLRGIRGYNSNLKQRYQNEDYIDSRVYIDNGDYIANWIKCFGLCCILKLNLFLLLNLLNQLSQFQFTCIENRINDGIECTVAVSQPRKYFEGLRANACFTER